MMVTKRFVLWPIAVQIASQATNIVVIWCHIGFTPHLKSSKSARSRPRVILPPLPRRSTRLKVRNVRFLSSKDTKNNPKAIDNADGQENASEPPRKLSRSVRGPTSACPKCQSEPSQKEDACDTHRGRLKNLRSWSRNDGDSGQSKDGSQAEQR